MAEKLLQTRIQLKYDTLANWEASSIVLKAGEAAVATYTYMVGETEVKAVKVKYGDGSNTFANLPEVTAVSKELSDAIAALRSEYETYVATHRQEVAIARAQQAELDALQDIALADYKNEMTTTLEELVTAQKAVDDAQDAAFEEYKTELATTMANDKVAQKAIDDAQDKALADYKTEMSNAIAADKEAQAAIDAAQDKALADYKTEQAAIDKAQDDAFEAYKTAHAQEIAISKAQQAELDALQDIALADYKNEMRDTLAADKAAQAEKDAAQDKALADAKTELNNAITAEKERAEGAEASLQNQINTIINNPDTEGVINSINEFTQYIADHGEIAEGFRTDIDKNRDDIAALEKKHDDYQVANDAAVAAVDKKVDDLDSSLAVIAKTGNVNDLIQTTGDVLVFNCGSSTVNVD